MPDDDAVSQNEVFNRSANEASNSQNSVIHSLLNQWTVVTGIVIAGALFSTLVGSFLHGEKPPRGRQAMSLQNRNVGFPAS